MSEPGNRAAKRAATARRILDAARAEFGERGLEATTIRRIAQRANVDPSLVMQHYGSKAALFAIAIQLGDAAPDEIAAHLHDVLDVRLAALPPQTKALVRSMLTAPEAAASMSAFLNERVANLSRAMGGDDADLRAALIVSSILGLTIARHFLKLDAFTRASDTDIARVARPWVTTGVDHTSGLHPRTSTKARPRRRGSQRPKLRVESARLADLTRNPRAHTPQPAGGSMTIRGIGDAACVSVEIHARGEARTRPSRASAAAVS